MRKLPALLAIIKDEFITCTVNKKQHNGICSVLLELHKTDVITHNERYIVERYFLNQKPTATLNPEFFNHRLFTGGDRFWWKAKIITDGITDNCRNEADTQRVDFMTMLIEKSKSEE